MKILKLEFQNINSIKSSGPVVIDFTSEVFRNTGIFAITGPTGAGKTTILDAITIALYRKVPRFNASHIKLGLDDVVSRGTDEAMSRVTFSNNGKTYEASWSIRIRSKSGKLLGKPIETVRLKNFNNNTIVAEKAKEYLQLIEEYTQLNYNQFLRSMMLAQGEFASFLKASKNDKVELLDQIIGNDIYKRIGYEVADRISREKKALEQLQQKTNTSDLLSEEKKEELRKEINEINAKINTLKNREIDIRKILKWYERYLVLKRKKAGIETEKEQLEKLQRENENILNALKLHRKAEPFEGLLKDIKLSERKIDNNKTDIAKLIPEINGLDEKLKEAFNRLKELDNNFDTSQKELSDWMPKLDKVNEFDTHITHKKSQIKTLKKEISDIAGNIRNKTEELSGKKDRVSVWKNESEKIEIFLETNAQIPKIAENFTSWSLKLNERKQKYGQIEKLENDNKTIKSKISKNNNQFYNKQTELKDIENEIAETGKLVKELEENLREADIAQLNKTIEQLNNEKHRVSEALRISKDYNAKAENIKELESNNIGFQKKVKDLSVEIEKTELQIEAGKKFLEEIERTRLIETKVKSLEEERRKLTVGQACPLCGSTEHPFVEKYLDYDFSEAEKRYTRQKELLKELEIIKAKSDSDKNSVSGEIKTNLHLIVQAKKGIENLVSEYKKSVIQTKIENTLQIDEKLNSIDEKLRVSRKNADEARKIQEKLNKKAGELNRIKEKKAGLSSEISGLKATINELTKNLNANQDEILKLKSETDRREAVISEQLSVYRLQLPQLENTQSFLDNLKAKIDEYSGKENSKIKLKNNIAVAVREIENIEGQIRDFDLRKQKMENELKDETGNLENLRNKRNAILPLEVLVQSKRKELQDKVAIEMNILNRHKENINDLKTKLSNKQNEKQKLDSDTEEQKENLKKLTVELESKLSASRFANRKQLEAALLDYETKTEYKKTEKQINSKVIGIETLISETLKEETVLEKERTFETTEEEALSDLESLNTEKETLLNRKGEVNNMFENDKLLRLRNSEILKEIEQQQKVVNKWDTLFSLLGGTKEAFNIYVQRLTLKGLINHANLHLSDLSQRYSLRLSEVYSKNEELNIRLIDHFQSNTVRAVETCSGGESFLLSLALALGLSDMASRNVIIESLFIDEGFGTLDDDLLDTVISSLETLHGKGKIIGVISHVEKLKERISTQIQVNKKGNGVSSIELL